MIEIFVVFASTCDALGQNRTHRLKETDVVPNAQRFLVGHCEREGARKLGDGGQ